MIDDSWIEPEESVVVTEGNFHEYKQVASRGQDLRMHEVFVIRYANIDATGPSLVYRPVSLKVIKVYCAALDLSFSESRNPYATLSIEAEALGPNSPLAFAYSQKARLPLGRSTSASYCANDQGCQTTLAEETQKPPSRNTKETQPIARSRSVMNARVQFFLMTRAYQSS